MDLAEGHLLALNYLINEKPQNLTINLGTGKGTSVLELINTFDKVNHQKIPWKFVERRPGDVPQCVADNSLCKKVLNWSPNKDIETMCKDGWKWASTHPNGY